MCRSSLTITGVAARRRVAAQVCQSALCRRVVGRSVLGQRAVAGPRVVAGVPATMVGVDLVGVDLVVEAATEVYWYLGVAIAAVVAHRLRRAVARRQVAAALVPADPAVECCVEA